MDRRRDKRLDARAYDRRRPKLWENIAAAGAMVLFGLIVTYAAIEWGLQ